MMASIVGAIIFGIIFAYFATQNRDLVSLRFAQYSYSNIPFYLVVLGSILFGIVFAWILSLSNTISSFFKLRSKDVKLKKSKEHETDLLKRLHQLELENASLKTKLNADDSDEKSL